MHDPLARFKVSTDGLYEALGSIASLAALEKGVSFDELGQVRHELGRIGRHIVWFRGIVDMWRIKKPDVFSEEVVIRLFDDLDKLHVPQRLAEIESDAYGDDLQISISKIIALDAEFDVWAQGYQRNSHLDKTLRSGMETG